MSAFSTKLDTLKELEDFADDASFVKEFMNIKQHNKEKLANKILKSTGVVVNTKSIFII